MRHAIFDIKRFAVHDGAGIRTTVFLKGCPLRCAWCQNPEGADIAPRLWWYDSRCIGCGHCVAVCPQQALTLADGRIAIDRDRCNGCGACVQVCPTEALLFDAQMMTVSAVLEEVLKDREFYAASGGGVTLSGGDPLAAPAFALALLAGCRTAGIATAIETCLAAPWETVAAFVPLVDHFLVDLKLADTDAHRRWTGQDNDGILDNLRRLIAAGAPLTLRVPLVPGVNDDEAQLHAIRAIVDGLDPSLPIEPVPFNPLAAAKYARLGRPWPFATAPRQDTEALARIRLLLARREG